MSDPEKIYRTLICDLEPENIKLIEYWSGRSLVKNNDCWQLDFPNLEVAESFAALLSIIGPFKFRKVE